VAGVGAKERVGGQAWEELLEGPQRKTTCGKKPKGGGEQKINTSADAKIGSKKRPKRGESKSVTQQTKGEERLGGAKARTNKKRKNAGGEGAETTLVKKTGRGRKKA